MIVPGDVRRIVCPTEPHVDGVLCLVLAERQGILGDRAWLVLTAGSTDIQHRHWRYLSKDERGQTRPA